MGAGEHRNCYEKAQDKKETGDEIAIASELLDACRVVQGYVDSVPAGDGLGGESGFAGPRDK
jgi:hypothetical protein